MLIEPYTNWDVEYKWQVSNNGVAWQDLTDEKKIRTVESNWNGNNAALTFQNLMYARYTFWRVLIGTGKTNQIPMYINFLRMKVTV